MIREIGAVWMVGTRIRPRCIGSEQMKPLATSEQLYEPKELCVLSMGPAIYHRTGRLPNGYLYVNLFACLLARYASVGRYQSQDAKKRRPVWLNPLPCPKHASLADQGVPIGRVVVCASSRSGVDTSGRGFPVVRPYGA